MIVIKRDHGVVGFVAVVAKSFNASNRTNAYLALIAPEPDQFKFGSVEFPVQGKFLLLGSLPVGILSEPDNLITVIIGKFNHNPDKIVHRLHPVGEIFINVVFGHKTKCIEQAGITRGKAWWLDIQADATFRASVHIIYIRYHFVIGASHLFIKPGDHFIPEKFTEGIGQPTRLKRD